MKGYAMLRIGEAEWIEKEDPECGPMDAICRPVTLAPCSSDIHTVYESGVGECHNMILGHGAVDEVVEAGSMIKDFEVGDQMVIPAITPDWSSMTTQENYAMHSDVPLGGWKFPNIKDGTFAELIHVNDAGGNLAHLPGEISPEVDAMLSDMVTTKLRGVRLTSIEPGGVVAVIGIGPVGLVSVSSVSVLDASRLFAAGSQPECIEIAQGFSATDIINYHEGGIVEQIMKATKGQGVNRVIAAGGDLDTFQQAFDILKVDNRVTNVNYLREGKNIKISHELTMVGMDHKHFVGGLAPDGRNRMDRIANLVLAGRIHPEKMITHHFTGIEHVEDGVELMRTRPRGFIEPVILV